MSSNSSTATELLSDSRAEAIMEALSMNEEYVSFFKNIDARLNELHKIVPKGYRNALYDIERDIGSIVGIANELAYRRGLEDGMSPDKQTASRRKPQYMIIEFESRRKDANRQYKGSKTGSIYRILKIVKEYTNEAEADRVLARLKAGEISEDDIFQKRKKN